LDDWKSLVLDGRKQRRITVAVQQVDIGAMLDEVFQDMEMSSSSRHMHRRSPTIVLGIDVNLYIFYIWNILSL
jgi:hypothetical protein